MKKISIAYAVGVYTFYTPRLEVLFQTEHLLLAGMFVRRNDPFFKFLKHTDGTSLEVFNEVLTESKKAIL